MSNFEILNIFSKIVSSVKKFKDIKKNPELRPVYTKYGVHSIIYSVLSVLSVLTIFLTSGLQNMENPVLAFFGLLLLIGISITCPIIFFIYSSSNIIMQLSLNKKAIGFIALAVIILILPIIYLVLSTVLL
ncbi:MAG: hypothetical protein WCX32_04210 [Clostridia bacterium]|jgi:hypothetical protein|nr:hypothetical protein [Clostridia bacterium]MDD4275744.1 hypothetical protein [Clostridia bacterium]